MNGRFLGSAIPPVVLAVLYGVHAVIGRAQIRADAARTDLALLQAKHPVLVGLSPHASSEAVIEIFHRDFQALYQDVAVGRAITLNSQLAVR